MADNEARVELEPFDGHEVFTTSVRIRRAGDGLSGSLGVDPVELHKGDRVTVVLDCVVNKIGFEPLKQVDGWDRVHDLVAEVGTIVPRSLVAKHLDAQIKKIEAAKEIEGQERIEVDDEEEGDEE